jgi:hypothetical protein
MIDLTAHSLAALQHGASICRQGQSAMMNLDELIAALEQAIPTAIPAAVQPVTESTEPPIRRACPTPGCKGTLTYWPQSSRLAGHRVVGCLLCRYSTMEVR